jgi:acetate kinase
MKNGSIDPTRARTWDGKTVIKKPDRSCILTVNGGSSSLKFALFEWEPAAGDPIQRPVTGQIERIGLADAHAVFRVPVDLTVTSQRVNAPDLGTAAELIYDWIEEHVGWPAIAGIGHRIVHGGPRYAQPERITPDLVAELRRIIPLDSDHLPGEIAVIETFRGRLPELPQIACFDAAFHHDMPRVAKIVPIPRRYEALGVHRYGFHGLSYAYLMLELARRAGAQAAAGRVILAHLGAGASMAAVHKGKCVDTTMGFTPASGLVMGTRTGDLDPGLPLFLAQAATLTTERFHKMVNHESGLLGVSETSSDVRDLLARQADDVRAAEALSVFVYHAKKSIGALAAALSGLDILVFSGGIGENSPEIRAQICQGLDFLGITLDDKRNAAAAPSRINVDNGRTRVWVIHTDEESMIARDTARLLAKV